MVELELHLNGAATLGSRERQAVEEVDARREVERFGESAMKKLGLDSASTEHHGGRVAVIPVDEHISAVDLEDGHRR